MNTISTKQLLEALNWRYAVKRFDPAKKISADLWDTLEQTLILTPSSYGLQPWKFLVVTNAEVKTLLKDVSWKQSQVVDCSHHVVFAIKKKVTEKDVQEFIEDTAKTRGMDASLMDGYKKMMIGDVVTGPRSKVAEEWAARQVYIALGNFMTAAAVLGVDTCPMEGIDPAAYDRILGLTESEYKTVVACPAGYRHAEDKYALAKKVRFPRSKMIQHVK